jgi:hypothetical protein
MAMSGALGVGGKPFPDSPCPVAPGRAATILRTVLQSGKQATFSLTGLDKPEQSVCGQASVVWLWTWSISLWQFYRAGRRFEMEQSPS